MAEKIRNLTFPEAVRRRPGMYIGGTDSRAMLGLLLQIVREQAEIAAVGKCQELQIHLFEGNTIMLRSYGSGYGQQVWDAVEPERRLGLMLSSGFYANAVANALSSDFKVEVHLDGEALEQSYKQGIWEESSRRARELDATEIQGVTVTFTLDPTIFEENVMISYPDLYVRLQEFAFLVPGWRIKVYDQRQQNLATAEFDYKNGLVDFVHYLNRDCVSVHDVIARSYEVEFRQPDLEGSAYAIKIDFAIQFTDCDKPFQLSFAQFAETSDGGVHIDELRRGIRDAILEAAKEKGLTVERQSNLFFRGMTAVIHVRHPNPQYAGCIQQRLINVDLSVVYPLVYQAIAFAELPLEDFLARTSTRLIANKHRRYGELAEQLQHSTVLY